MNHPIRCGVLTAVFAILTAAAAVAAEAKEPFMGDYEGQWSRGVWPRTLAAQVIPRGGGQYEIVFVPELYQRAAPYATISGQAEAGALRFDAVGWKGSAEGKKMTGSGVCKSPRLGAAPPPGAIVLFDGSGFDQWQGVFRRETVDEITWKIVDGVMHAAPTFDQHDFAPSIAARPVFTDFHLHLEFRLPLLAESTGQNRANSGVIIEDFNFYEVQVLDSYGLVGYYDDCGAVYRIAAPKQNMCLPPLAWQSYDVVYHDPRHDAEGNRVRPARITVDHNGKLIHKDVELPDSPGAQKLRREQPDSRKPGRITLQNHGDPMEYRNIWMLDLSGSDD